MTCWWAAATATARAASAPGRIRPHAAARTSSTKTAASAATRRRSPAIRCRVACVMDASRIRPNKSRKCHHLTYLLCNACHNLISSELEPLEPLEPQCYENVIGSSLNKCKSQRQSLVMIKFVLDKEDIVDQLSSDAYPPCGAQTRRRHKLSELDSPPPARLSELSIFSRRPFAAFPSTINQKKIYMIDCSMHTFIKFLSSPSFRFHMTKLVAGRSRPFYLRFVLR